MQRTLQGVSQVIFPESKNLAPSERPFFTASKEIASSVPLQILLYFNLFFSIIWFLCEGIVLLWKVSHGRTITVAGILFIVWSVVEPLRITLGYSGNLREKVASLAGFIILSFVPVGISIYLLIFQKHRIPLELCLVSIMLAFVVPEILLGYNTARIFVRLQTQRFYLQVASAANMAQVEMDEMQTYSNAYGDDEMDD